METLIEENNTSEKPEKCTKNVSTDMIKTFSQKRSRCKKNLSQKLFVVAIQTQSPGQIG